jgi:PKD repeat protein
MKAYDVFIPIILIFCLMSLVLAAPDNATNNTSDINNTSVSISTAASSSTVSKVPNWVSDGVHSGSTAGKVSQSTFVGTTSNKVAAITGATAASEVAFIQVPSTGKCLDNKKKVAVYMPAVTNPVVSESLTTDPDDPVFQYIPVAYDPLATAMFFEYNPDYLGDSTISSKLTKDNYELLIVPLSQMSTTASDKIRTYIMSGGSVWFLNDPCMTPTGTSNLQLTDILGGGVSGSIGSSTISVVNNDSITNGLSASYTPVGTTAKNAEFRTLTGSSIKAGLSYQVLMSSGTKALLVKFENSTTGARVIYSNPNIFISGGTSSYFNASTATKLFTQTKSWIMNFSQNPSVLGITYPGSDKQLTVTIDDLECASWDAYTTMLFDNETSLGIAPSSVNTFYIIPWEYLDQTQVNYYANYGDTHTIHAHEFYDNKTGTWYTCQWDVNSTSVDTYNKNISALKQNFSSVMGTSDYGFTSWRFPMTTYCDNSMQAVSDSNFVIESSNGNAGDGFVVGNKTDNTLMFPEQVLVDNAKTNLIEFPLIAAFDIDCTSGTAYYNEYNAYTSQFKNVNFPANFIIGGHYQGIGMDGTIWNVSISGLTAGLKNILKAEKAADPNYATINTLANYINGIKSATITATFDGNSTNVTVVNTKNITNFTIKAGVGSVKSATCSDGPVTIKTDKNTTATYITRSLAAGTHTFVITSNLILPEANFSSNVTPPFTVQLNDTSKYETGWRKWDFGDGTNSTQQNVTKVYTAAGNYIVNLTVSNANGTSTKSATINVSLKPVLPVANFTSNVTQGSAPLAVLFNGTSTNASVWKWDFGDGTNSTERNTTHVFTAVGNFTVNLTASNANGSNSSLAPINVTGITVFPNCTNPPTDLNNDKLYEDINGNGQLDFDDVVAYLDTLEWIRQKGLTTNFDFDNSGSIDYNDVVKLYGMI